MRRPVCVKNDFSVPSFWFVATEAAGLNRKKRKNYGKGKTSWHESAFSWKNLSFLIE